jgi:HAD superfamily hydrolase (TIGR01509 family)
MNQKPKIKAVIFDLGGVVMSGGYIPFILHYCVKCLTPAGAKKIKQLEHDVNLGKITEKEFYIAIQKIFNVRLNPARMREIITDKMQANETLLKFLPKLGKAKLAIFTNSIGHMAYHVLQERKVLAKHLFDKIFYSNKIHLAKPDKPAYMYVLQALKVKPQEALLVDDRLDNINPAKALGMHGIVFKDTAQFKKEIKKFDLE